MRLLLDTSGGELVSALADAKGVVVEQRSAGGTPESHQFGEQVGRTLGTLLPRELDAIVVGTGPGTFIGTRVALSFANGLAVAGDVPLYAVNSLAAIAAVHGQGGCVVLRDARRGEVYWLGPGASAGCELVAVDTLARTLAAAPTDKVVLDDSPAVARGWRDSRGRIESAVQQAGMGLSYAPGVPAGGLRQLALKAARVGYAEPEYLRGFL